LYLIKYKISFFREQGTADLGAGKRNPPLLLPGGKGKREEVKNKALLN